MNYLDVFFSRINHNGETTAERVRNAGIRSFQRWLDESPHTVLGLSVERGIYFDAIILTHKDKEYKKLLKLNVAIDIPLMVGDIMNWQKDDGSIEKWLILSEELKVNGNHRVFEIIRCNYLIKWIDAAGHLQSCWAYAVSSTDSMIKGNFRTWHNLITPQPNKYAEIIMPTRGIDRGTNFILEDESWKLVENDFTSIPGITYLSLTENKVNMIYDDLVNDIADTDKLAQYRIDLPPITQIFHVGDIIEPVCTLMKNGVPYEGEIIWSSLDKSVVHLVDNQLVAGAAGTARLVATLKDYPEITQEIEVTVGEGEQEFSAYIEGNDKIRLDFHSTYTLKGLDNILSADFSLRATDLAEITKIENNTCEVQTNNKNKLGTITLVATYNGTEYTKEIKIVPLW